MQRYDILKRLGDGTYGTVWMGKSRENGELVAIKTLKRKFATWKECLSLRELKSLQSFSKNKNIVQIKELIREDDSQLHFVFEYMPDGNVYQLIKRCIDSRSEIGSFIYEISAERVKSIVSQVLCGLDHIHGLGFIHRDIKPENLLMHGNTCKIADFGLARMTRSTSSAPALTEYISTRWYRAPEVLLRDPKYTTSIDIFAVGCVMAEMITLSPLFPGNSEIDQIHKVFAFLGKPTESTWPDGVRLLERMKILPNMDSSLSFNGVHTTVNDVSLNNLIKTLPTVNPPTIAILHKMLLMNPWRRPTAKDLIHDTYFWSNDENKTSALSTECKNNLTTISNGTLITASPPSLEAEVLRREKRNKSRVVSCHDNHTYLDLPNNSLSIHSNGLPLGDAKDLEYQHCGRNVKNQPIHYEYNFLTSIHKTPSKRNSLAIAQNPFCDL